MTFETSTEIIRLRGGQDGRNTTKTNPKMTGQGKGDSLGDKLAILKFLDSRKFSNQMDEEICGLPTMLGKQVLVLTTDGRNMYGTLECFDRNTNLILNNVSERVFPQFDVTETSDDLEVPVTWPIKSGADSIDWALVSGKILNSSARTILDFIGCCFSQSGPSKE